MISDEKIIIDTSPGEKRVAVLKNNRLANLFIERHHAPWLRGAIILARITATRKELGASFLDLGTSSGYIEHGKINQPIDGESLLVQVLNDAHRKKSARVSSNICLRGKYFDLYPVKSTSSISRKIKSKKKRGLIKQFIDENIPNGIGVHIRESFDVSDLLCMKEVTLAQLQKWKNVEERISKSCSPSILMPSLGALGQAMEKYPNANVYEGRYGGLFRDYGVDLEINRALERKISLDSGAYLFFDETEALTSIDIDIGSGSKPRSETTSLVAHLAEEILWQLRLREIGGIILIDFPRFKNFKIRDNFLENLQSFALNEEVPLVIHGWTRTGLLEITKPREGVSLKEVLVGTVEDNTPALETVALKVLRCLMKKTTGIAYPEVICSLSLKNVINTTFDKEVRNINDKLGAKVLITEDSEMTDNEFLIKNGINSEYDVR